MSLDKFRQKVFTVSGNGWGVRAKEFIKMLHPLGKDYEASDCFLHAQCTRVAGWTVRLRTASHLSRNFQRGVRSGQFLFTASCRSHNIQQFSKRCSFSLPYMEAAKRYCDLRRFKPAHHQGPTGFQTNQRTPLRTK